MEFVGSAYIPLLLVVLGWNDLLRSQRGGRLLRVFGGGVEGVRKKLKGARGVYLACDGVGRGCWL